MNFYDRMFEENGYERVGPEPEPEPKHSDHWLAVTLAFVVLGMFALGYMVAWLQWEALSA